MVFSCTINIKNCIHWFSNVKLVLGKIPLSYNVITLFQQFGLTYQYFVKNLYIFLRDIQFSSVQLLSRVQLFVTPWTAAFQASLSITNSQCLSKLTSIESVMPSNHPSSVMPFSSHLQSFPASGSFQMSQVAKVFGVSASASVLPMNIKNWFPLGWTSWISLLSKGLPRVFKSISSLDLSFLYSPTLASIYDYWKTIALTRQNFSGKVMSLLLNILSRFVKTFLPRRSHLLISWPQSPRAVILEPQNIKSVTVSAVSPSICYEVMGPEAMI